MERSGLSEGDLLGFDVGSLSLALLMREAMFAGMLLRRRFDCTGVSLGFRVSNIG